MPSMIIIFICFQAAGNEKFTFFWRSESPFSQFHSAEFTVDGIKYNCAEQYMMHQKAGGLSSKEGTRMQRYGIVVVVAHNVLSCCSELLRLDYY